ncbi:hypothetical protein V5799_000279 [Amblyomma americanum]|uniref:Secreted protein n=1 Tax=Amblyomma americanum TaxID=6943 RepID=A0AAQ4D3H9_AMBAM
MGFAQIHCLLAVQETIALAFSYFLTDRDVVRNHRTSPLDSPAVCRIFRQQEVPPHPWTAVLYCVLCSIQSAYRSNPLDHKLADHQQHHPTKIKGAAHLCCTQVGSAAQPRLALAIFTAFSPWRQRSELLFVICSSH